MHHLILEGTHQRRGLQPPSRYRKLPSLTLPPPNDRRSVKSSTTMYMKLIRKFLEAVDRNLRTAPSVVRQPINVRDPAKSRSSLMVEVIVDFHLAASCERRKWRLISSVDHFRRIQSKTRRRAIDRASGETEQEISRGAPKVQSSPHSPSLEASYCRANGS